MVKVKVFQGFVEGKINEFIEENNIGEDQIIDIKFCANITGYGAQGTTDEYYAMLVYKTSDVAQKKK